MMAEATTKLRKRWRGCHIAAMTTLSIDELRRTLLEVSRETLRRHDPAHDFGHALRVLKLCEHLGRSEHGDLEILIPAALFHDAVMYPKNDERSANASAESAAAAASFLERVEGYPRQKAAQVATAIAVCSFKKRLPPPSLEAAILQDADRLEACGAFGVMRTFASAGQMGVALVDMEDPQGARRPHNSFRYALDLFFERLLVVPDVLHTAAAKRLAAKRRDFVQSFLQQVLAEIALTPP